MRALANDALACAEVVVYHSGMLNVPYAAPDTIAHGMAAERDALRALGDEAGAHGIRIAVENVHPTNTRIRYSAYGYDLTRLGEQVAAVDHPQVGIYLDTGHGFLSPRALGFDYLAQIRAIAPLVNHLHVTDNLGRPLLAEDMDSDESLVLGLGDLHLPPGWGAIPFTCLFAIPFPQHPIATPEITPMFHPHMVEALATTRALLTPVPHAEPAVASGTVV